MDIRMESTPCNSCHWYLQYTHKSDKGMAELTWQLSLQTQLQIFSQHFSYLTQVSLQWKQYLKQMSANADILILFYWEKS